MHRTVTFQHHALNTTAEAWTARCQATYTESSSLSLDAIFEDPAASCWLRFLEHVDVHGLLRANAGTWAGRAKALAHRPKAHARLSVAGMPPRTRAHFLVVDPLATAGADQLSALPMMSARLAHAARAMEIDLDAVIWRSRDTGQPRLVSRMTEGFLARCAAIARPLCRLPLRERS